MSGGDNKKRDRVLSKAADVLAMPFRRKYEIETGMPYWCVELKPTTSPKLWWVSWHARGRRYTANGYTTWFESKAKAQRFIKACFTRKTSR